MRIAVLKIDPVACDGRGLCAELLAERITLDDWGFPIIEPTPISGDLLVAARGVVRLCPKVALHLEPMSLQRDP